MILQPDMFKVPVLHFHRFLALLPLGDGFEWQKFCILISQNLYKVICIETETLLHHANTLSAFSMLESCAVFLINLIPKLSIIFSVLNV